MNAISIGPIVLAPDRFAAILAIGSFVLAAALLARRVDGRLDSWASLSAIAGITTARIGHVLLHWSSFRDEPARIFSIWQGGFDILSGLAGVALMTAIFARSVRFTAGAAAALGIGALVGTATLELTRASHGQQAPITRMATLDGATRSIRDFEGRPAVINLWASWCPPCRREMPMMARMAAERQNVHFVFVNQGEDPDKIRRYLNRDNLQLSNILLDAAMDVSRHYQAPGLPVTLFLRRDGTLASVHTGEISQEALAAGIAALEPGAD